MPPIYFMRIMFFNLINMLGTFASHHWTKLCQMAILSCKGLWEFEDSLFNF